MMSRWATDQNAQPILVLLIDEPTAHLSRVSMCIRLLRSTSYHMKKKKGKRVKHTQFADAVSHET